MRYIITVLLICFITPLQAQIKAFDFGGVLLTGNNRNVQITTKMTYEYNNKNKDIGFNLTPYYFLFYGQQNNQMTKQSEDGRLGIFSWKEIKNNYSFILFSTVEHSLVKKLDLGISGGFGIKKSFKGEKLNGSISLAYVYDKSDIINTWFNSQRLSYRHTFKYKLKDYTLEHNALLQPAVISSNNLLWDKNTVGNYNFSLTKNLTKTASAGFIYESYLSTLSSNIDSKIKPLDQRFSLIFKYTL
jgi:hypothetical protein